MPALNFQKRFAPDVESQKKRQTIRTVRKHPIKEGDTLYLYTGMRQRGCRKLGEVMCKSVEGVTIARGGLLIRVNGKPLDSLRANSLAEADGFDSVEEMIYWFEQTHGLPFEGVLIKW